MTSTKTFDVSDLDRELLDSDRLIVAENIMAWADLDTGISRLILLEFGVKDDEGSILIGSMDLKTKLEKMKTLCEHRNDHKYADIFKKLLKDVAGWSQCRNVIAHRKCVGKLISEPSRLVFLSAKHVKGKPGQFELMAVDHSELKASARFARRVAELAHNRICQIEGSHIGI